MNYPDQKRLKTSVFSPAPYTPSAAVKSWKVKSYSVRNGDPFTEIESPEGKIYGFGLPVPGVHSAANAAAVLATTEMLGIGTEKALQALCTFKGVWRRFNFAGTTFGKVKVYDDYAHNVEKMTCSIRTAQEISGGKIIAVFQPHGFGPLKFMREKLSDAMAETLRKDDILILLPVYYAGGSTTFVPTSEEVADEYRTKNKFKCMYCPGRDAAVTEITRQSARGDLVLVMGARDNSLSTWAEEIAESC
jgi:UDP-N-acetylmuramate--alanine ligase